MARGEANEKQTRRQTYLYAFIAVACLFVLALFFRSPANRPGSGTRSNGGGGGGGSREKATHNLVIVTVARLTPTVEKPALPYAAKVKADREAYCAQHGCQVVFKDADDYVPSAAAGSLSDVWAKLPVLREVLEEYKGRAEWIWLLDSDAIIMDHSTDVVTAFLTERRLDSLMQRDAPIVPPDSIIRTPREATPSEVSFVISHDHAGISTRSFVLRNDDYSRFLLEFWNSPLYRAYNFDRQEQSALEHVLQWHYTILARTALLPKKSLASYGEVAPQDVHYEDGDFVVALHDCHALGRSCEREFDRYYGKRRHVVAKTGGGGDKQAERADGVQVPTTQQQAKIAAAADRIMNGGV